MDERYNFLNLEQEFRKYISSGNNSLGRNTVKNYLSDLRYFLGWYNHKIFNGTPPEHIQNHTQFLSRLNEPIISDYLRYLEASVGSDITIKRRISSLSTFIKYCLNSGYITEHYLKLLKKSEKIKAVPEIVQKDDATLITTPALPLKPELEPNLPKDHFIVPKGAILFAAVLVSLFLGLLGISSLVAKPQGQTLGSFQVQKSNQNSRVLTYRGRLTDPVGNPVTTKTDVRFKLYSNPVTSNPLYESNSCVVYPDVNGNFQVAIGSDKRYINSLGCDKKIPDELFTSTQPLYLGITVGNNAEMKPRQQVSNVALADSALKLNGLEAGDGVNSIPYINNNGEIVLSSESPGIAATANSKDFRITSNNSLLLQTANGGDIVLSATGSGKIRFNTGGEGTDKMVIAENGNVGFGTMNPSYFKVEVSGSVGPSVGSTYNLGAANRLWDTLYVNRICFDGEEKNCTSGLGGSQATSSAVLQNYTSADLLIGNNATSSANIKLSAKNGDPSFIRSGYLGVNTPSPTSALDVMGTATFGGNEIDITTHTNEDLTLKANGSGVINLNNDTNVGGNFAAGVNVVGGTTTLDIAGTPTSFALCHSSESGTDNQQIVDCGSTPTADFAEMYPVENGTDYGDVMSIGPDEVKTTDGHYIRKLVASSKPYDNHMLGVVSNNYGDFISVGYNLSKSDNPKPIALKGRVPVKMSSNSPSLKAGDYLTASEERGKATKAVRSGVVLGKALENWDPLSGKNQIMVFVDTTYAVPEPSNDPVTAVTDFAKGIASSLVIKERIISPVVETDQLLAKNITTENINVKNTVSAENATFSALLKANDATISGTLNGKNASFSGTIVADSVDAKNIKDLESRLTGAVQQTNYSKDMNEIQNTLGEIRNSQLPKPELYPPPPSSLKADDGMEGLFNNLIVSGDTSLFNLNVHEKIYSLQDELKISALSSINFLDGAIVMTRDGNVTVRGTLTAKEVRAQKLSVMNDQGQEVAGVNASGEARFARLSLDTSLAATPSSTIIASDRSLLENGVPLPAIETKKEAAGVGIVPENQSKVVIYNEGLHAESLIFLTPTDASASANLSVAQKETCDSKPDCKPYFTVSAGSAPHPDIHFNWFILNSR